jgi:cobalt-zinc-cadmium efflux system membrane fusion protein
MDRSVFLPSALALILAVLTAGCDPKANADPRLEEPPPAEVEHGLGAAFVTVSHPERFPVAIAAQYASAPELEVTGVVSADVSRNVPVVSMAAGRILEIRTRLGDSVTKGQLLMRVQSADIAGEFSQYRQSLADETLARTQLERSSILYEKGAIAKKDLEVAQDTEEKAKVAVETAVDRLRVLGADQDHPSPVVDVLAPASGVITDQQVTAASGTLGLASPNAFTISDLSSVWIVCDVYESDLALVRTGEYADVRLNAYPNILLHGRIGNIGAILDPNIRTAKVRIEMQNRGLMRLGMFVQATFHGPRKQVHAVVPASAVLHLHDRDWVFVPQGGHTFRRLEVVSGPMALAGQQEILSGIQPGERVVTNAVLLQNTPNE